MGVINPTNGAGYQLRANAIFPKISNLIVESRVYDAFEQGEWRDQLLEFLGKGQTEYGDGFQYVFETELLPGYDTDYNSGDDVLKLYRPKLKGVALTADIGRTYAISNTEAITQQAFEDGDVVANIIDLTWAQPEKAARKEWSNYGLALLGASKARTIELDMTATGTTPLERNAAKLEIYQNLATQIQGLCDAATVESKDYTNGESSTELSADRLVFIYNKKYLNDMKATVLAPMFKGEVILEMSNIEASIAIPEAAMLSVTGLQNVICIVTTWERFNLIYKFISTGTFTNGSIANTQTTFRNVMGGFGEVEDFFAAIFKDKGFTPPPPLTPFKKVIIESNKQQIELLVPVDKKQVK